MGHFSPHIRQTQKVYCKILLENHFSDILSGWFLKAIFVNILSWVVVNFTMLKWSWVSLHNLTILSFGMVNYFCFYDKDVMKITILFFNKCILSIKLSYLWISNKNIVFLQSTLQNIHTISKSFLFWPHVYQNLPVKHKPSFWLVIWLKSLITQGESCRFVF